MTQSMFRPSERPLRWTQIVTAIHFGAADVSRQYRRTLLGPLWLVFGVTIWVSSMAFVFSILLKQPIIDFFPYVVTGMLIWTIYTNSAMDGCVSYLSSSDLIAGIPLHPGFFIFRTFTKNAYIGVHYLVMIIIINLFFGITPDAFSLLISISLIAILLFELISIQAYINARYRDVAPVTSMFLQVVPLVSAIAWQPEMLGKFRYLADFNPFFQVVQLVREPLLGITPTTTNYASTIIYIIILGFISAWSFKGAIRDVFYLL